MNKRLGYVTVAICMMAGFLVAPLVATAEDFPVAQAWAVPNAPLASNELLLQGGAVAVSCTWRSQYNGQTGVGTPIPQTNDVGQFWFSVPSNSEVFVKVLDFGSATPYLLFWGGLTDFEYTVVYRQTQTGKTVSFRKDAGSACGGTNTTSLDHPVGPPPLANEVTVMLPGGVPLVMEKIPAGTFQMGSPTTERNRQTNETLHQVTLTADYYMGKYLVTQGQWQAVMGTPMPTDCGSYGIGANYPVYCVSWDDIRGTNGFITKLNAYLTTGGTGGGGGPGGFGRINRDIEGAGLLRLPTEAEWERAARGGTQTRFSFGDALGGDDACGANADADSYVWWCNNSSAAHPVGTKLANQYGLFDMHGNPWEWVEDRYEASYPSTPQTDPSGPTSGSFRVYRGGSWTSYLYYARSAHRGNGNPTSLRNYNIGFRLAMSAENAQSVAPQISSFTASPSSIAAGQSSTLSWASTGGTSASIDNGVGAVATSGSVNVSPSTTTTYTLTVTSAGGAATKSVMVPVS